MGALIQKLKRVLFPMTTKTVPAGRVDHSQFEQQIDHYRNLGTKIGEKVRLLGRIDGVKLHLVSIGVLNGSQIIFCLVSRFYI